MECFRCGRYQDFDRIAIERQSGDILGVLCERCEQDFIHRGADASFVSIGTCLICGEAPDLFFPKWDTLVEEEEEATPRFEYTVSLDTPACCTTCAVQSGGIPIEHVGDRAATD